MSKEKNTKPAPVSTPREETTPVAETPKKEEEVKPNSRCNDCHYCNVPAHVGKPSTADSLKLRWHQTFFNRVMEVLPDGRHRNFWTPKKGGYPSLKQYAKELVAKKDETAKDWLDHKGGSLNETRSDKNTARILQEKQASKAARRKKKAGGGKDATAAAAAPTVTK